MLEASGGDVYKLMQRVVERQRESKHQLITQPFRHRTEQTDRDSDGCRERLSQHRARGSALDRNTFIRLRSRRSKMKFKLKSLLVATAFIALLVALWMSHERTRSTNLEASKLASELYRKHLLRELEKPYGSLFPPGWTAIVTGQGDIIDLTTASGRTDLLARIEEGKTDFRVRFAGGRIMQQADLITTNYQIYSWQTERPSRLLSCNSLTLPSDNQYMHQSAGGSTNSSD